MEENIIIQGKSKMAKIMLWSFIGISVLYMLILIALFTDFFMGCQKFLSRYESCHNSIEYFHDFGECRLDRNECLKSDFLCTLKRMSLDKYDYFRELDINDKIITFIPAGSLILIGVLLYFLSRSIEITVTDKRVYGKAFCKTVDLPIDSISAVSNSLCGSIAVASSSGRIIFSFISNAKEIHSEISKLLIERQEVKKEPTAPISNALTTIEELKKYKELLDAGIITQEEFETKKKQLL